MSDKEFPSIRLPETDTDPDSMARHISDPDPHPMYMKQSEPLGLNYVMLYRSLEEFRKLPVQTNSGLYSPSLVFFIGGNEVTDQTTGLTFVPYHPYAYDGITIDVGGTSYPRWVDKVDSFGDFTSIVRNAIMAHAEDRDGLVQRIHPTLAAKNHTHTSVDITDITAAVQRAVSDGYLSIYTAAAQFNVNPEQGKTVLYNGSDTNDYKCGHIYKYNAAIPEWEDKTAVQDLSTAMSEMVTNHNNEVGFDHSNLPYASLDQVAGLESTVTNLTNNVSGIVMKEVAYYYLDASQPTNTEIIINGKSCTVLGSLNTLFNRIRPQTGVVKYVVYLKPGNTYNLINAAPASGNLLYKKNISFERDPRDTEKTQPITLYSSNSVSEKYRFFGCSFFASGISFKGTIGFDQCYVEIRESELLQTKDVLANYAILELSYCQFELRGLTSPTEGATGIRTLVHIENSQGTIGSLVGVGAANPTNEAPAITMEHSQALLASNISLSGWNYGITALMSDIHYFGYGPITANKVAIKADACKIHWHGPTGTTTISAKWNAMDLRTTVFTVAEDQTRLGNQFKLVETDATIPANITRAVILAREKSILTVNRLNVDGNNIGPGIVLKSLSDLICDYSTFEKCTTALQIEGMSKVHLNSNITFNNNTRICNIQPNLWADDGSRLNGPASLNYT